VGVPAVPVIAMKSPDIRPTRADPYEVRIVVPSRPQGSLSASGVVREAGKDPWRRDRDRVVRSGAGRVEAADRVRERRRVVERKFAAGARGGGERRGPGLDEGASSPRRSLRRSLIFIRPICQRKPTNLSASPRCQNLPHFHESRRWAKSPC
jgi:hypothetical protein